MNAKQVIDWSFASRSERAAFQQVRASLPRGTHVIETSGRLGRGSLAGFDVLVLTHPTGAPLDVEELAVVDDFVRRGGALFALYNAAPRDLAPMFGAVSGSAMSRSGTGKIAESPLCKGPGGTLVAGADLPIGAAWTFSSLSDNGTAILESEVDGESDDFVVVVVVGACFTHGKGRAVIIGDEEIFSSVGVPGLAAARLGPMSSALFQNAMAWLTVKTTG